LLCKVKILTKEGSRRLKEFQDSDHP